MCRNRIFTNSNNTVNVSGLKEDPPKDRYAKPIYSMMIYSSNKLKVDNLVKSYENFARNRYQPAILPNYDISRNPKLSMSSKGNIW